MDTGKVLLFAVLGVVVLVGIGCETSEQSKEIAVVIEAESHLGELADQIRCANPTILEPRSGRTYKMKFVQPDSNVDYKILALRSDPNRRFTMRIIDPITRQEVSGLSLRALEERVRQIELHDLESNK